MNKPIYFELPVAWKSKTQSMLEELNIEGGYEDDIAPLVVDLNEIAGFNPVPENNRTTLRFYFGIAVECIIPFDEFKKFFEDKTGIVIQKYGR